jgi:hypothetical protein
LITQRQDLPWGERVNQECEKRYVGEPSQQELHALIEKELAV